MLLTGAHVSVLNESSAFNELNDRNKWIFLRILSQWRTINSNEQITNHWYCKYELKDQTEMHFTEKVNTRMKLTEKIRTNKINEI